MRILVAPVLVGDRICRIVSPVASLLEVEEWVGEWWEPSGVTLTAASQAAPAPVALLNARGIPEPDRIVDAAAAEQLDIQRMLRAQDPTPGGSLPSEERAPRTYVGPRRRQYSGNARFRRPPAEPARGGPKRRASDEPKGDRPGPQTS